MINVHVCAAEQTCMPAFMKIFINLAHIYTFIKILIVISMHTHTQTEDTHLHTHTHATTHIGTHLLAHSRTIYK